MTKSSGGSGNNKTLLGGFGLGRLIIDIIVINKLEKHRRTVVEC